MHYKLTVFSREDCDEEPLPIYRQMLKYRRPYSEKKFLCSNVEY